MDKQVKDRAKELSKYCRTCEDRAMKLYNLNIKGKRTRLNKLSSKYFTMAKGFARQRAVLLLDNQQPI